MKVFFIPNLEWAVTSVFNFNDEPKPFFTHKIESSSSSSNGDNIEDDGTFLPSFSTGLLLLKHDDFNDLYLSEYQCYLLPSRVQEGMLLKPCN